MILCLSFFRVKDRCVALSCTADCDDMFTGMLRCFAIVITLLDAGPHATSECQKQPDLLVPALDIEVYSCLTDRNKSCVVSVIANSSCSNPSFPYMLRSSNMQSTAWRLLKSEASAPLYLVY